MYKRQEWEDDAEEHALRADDADDARPRGLDGDDDGGFDRGDVDDGGDEPGGTGDGARSVRAAAERLLLGLLDASRRSPQPSGLEAAVLDGAVGAQAAEALLGAVDRVSSSPDALRRLGKEELAHFRGFFARAEAGLRAGGVAAGALADALPDDAPQRVRRWIGGALPRLLRGLRNAALAPPVALHVNFSTHVVLAAVRRRLYWFARCWAFSLYDAPELIALVCGEASADAAEGDAAVAGQIDLLVQDEDGDYHIVDYKRTANDLTPNASCWGKRFLGNLPLNDHHKYSLQLQLYAIMLELQTGEPVRSMRLMQVHPELDAARLIETTDMREHATELLRGVGVPL